MGLFREKGFAFDLEIPTALSENNVAIEEVPVDWTHVSGSKVQPVRDAVAMVLSLIRIQRRRAVWREAKSRNVGCSVGAGEIRKTERLPKKW